ncbi:MAG: hypothetical protein ACRC3B_11685 [Bacteroidia bacterium]
MKPDIELLSTIGPAEVSPFLFTRIEQRIKQQLSDKLSPAAAWTIAVATAAIIMLNVTVLATTQKSVSSEQNNAMLSTPNNLYNE